MAVGCYGVKVVVVFGCVEVVMDAFGGVMVEECGLKKKTVVLLMVICARDQMVRAQSQRVYNPSLFRCSLSRPSFISCVFNYFS